MALPLTVPRLARAMPNAGVDRLAAWVGPLEQAMLTYSIDTNERAAAFLANVAHESRELTRLAEDLQYHAPRLREVFPRYFPDDATAERYVAAGPAAIANRVYANRLGNGPEESGDGWKYRARGPLGITFKNNHLACSRAIAGVEDLLEHMPDLLEVPAYGAKSAAWYWSVRGCNAYADRGDFDGVCDVINLGRKTIAQGDSNGFADRGTYLKAFTRELS